MTFEAATNAIPALEQQLENTTEPIARITLLNKIAAALKRMDSRAAYEKSREAFVLAEAQSDPLGMATALLTMGSTEVIHGQYDQALDLLHKALSLFETLQLPEGIGQAFYSIGVVYRQMGDFNAALESYLKSLAIRKALGDESGEAACYAQIAYINEQFNNLDETDTYNHLSVAIYRKLNDQAGVAAVLVGIGNVARKKKNYLVAKEALEESLRIREQISEISGWMVTMNYLGSLYLEQQLYSQAEECFLTAINKALALDTPFPAGMCRLHMGLGSTYRELDASSKAINHLTIALELAIATNQKYLIHDIFKVFSDVYKSQGDFEQALLYYEKFHSAKEEVMSLTANAKLKHLELLNQIEVEKRETEIHKLRHIELKKAFDELRQTQQQLIQAEKMASLGELTAGIAHEIQNPLNFVNNFSELSVELVDELKGELAKGDLREAGLIVDDLVQNLQKIYHHGGRASSIVKGMLEHSRNTSDKKQSTDLNALANEYLQIAYNSFKAKNKARSTGQFTCELVTNFDAALGPIEVVPQEIGRVLLNLYNNAFYTVSERVKQGHQADYQPMVKVSTQRSNDQLMIRVQDNGTGISESVKAKVFQPFFTTKPTGEGTGLGLSLSYDIVTKGHQGSLLVNSQEGEGTEFIIQLPSNKLNLFT